MDSGQWCCVPGCPSPHGEVYYHFPKDHSMSNAWLKSIHETEIVKEFNFDQTRICSLHFKETDYMEVVNQDLTEMRLLPEAVPSIFPWNNPQGFKSYEQYSESCLCENCFNFTEKGESTAVERSIQKSQKIRPPTVRSSAVKPRKSTELSVGIHALPLRRRLRSAVKAYQTRSAPTAANIKKEKTS